MHNEGVMEMMWGIQHIMHELVPDEKVELNKEDRLPMSRGLKMFLSQNGFDVEPEMVSLVVGGCWVSLVYVLILCVIVNHSTHTGFSGDPECMV